MTDATFEQGGSGAGSGDDVDGVPPLAFWQQGHRGRTAGWRYLPGIPLIMIATLLASLGAWLVAAKVSGRGLGAIGFQDWRSIPLDSAMLNFTVFLLPFVLLLLVTFLVVSLLHGRGPRSLMTAAPRFRWKWVGISFALILALAVVLMLLNLLISPDSVSYVFDPGAFVRFLPLVLLLIPLQVLAEEVFFRGYLLQMCGRFTKRAWIIILVPALLFWAAHLANGPVAIGGVWALLIYGVMALYLTMLVAMSNGLEHALGIHLAINLHAFLIEGSAGGWYPTPTVFLTEEGDYSLTFLATLVIFLVHYVVVFRVLGHYRKARAS